ncbi:high mobility group box domain-containing protein, partial [Mycena floridula]
IPRPPNAFIVFRSSYGCNNKSGIPEQKRSKSIAAIWNAMSPEEKNPWFKRCEQLGREHKAQYPDYKFRP